MIVKQYHLKPALGLYFDFLDYYYNMEVGGGDKGYEIESRLMKSIEEMLQEINNVLSLNTDPNIRKKQEYAKRYLENFYSQTKPLVLA